MKKWIRISVLFLGLMLVFIGLAPTYQAQEPAEGFVYQFDGQVQILRGPWWIFWGWQQVEQGTELMAGDRVRVGAASSAEIELYNQSHLKVLENSLLIVGESEYVEYDYTQEEVRTSSVRLQRGQVWAKVERAVSKILKFKVETPNSVAGVRGTSFIVKVQDQKTQLLVDEGLVEIRQKRLDQAATLVSGGHRVQVTKEEEPTEPTQLRDEERQELQEWVKQVKREENQREKIKEDVERNRLEREKAQAEKKKEEQLEKKIKEEKKSSDEKHVNRGKSSEHKNVSADRKEADQDDEDETDQDHSHGDDEKDEGTDGAEADD